MTDTQFLRIWKKIFHFHLNNQGNHDAMVGFIFDELRKLSLEDLENFMYYQHHYTSEGVLGTPPAMKMVFDKLKYLHKEVRQSSKPLAQWLDEVRTKLLRNGDGQSEIDAKGSTWWSGGE